MSLIHTGANRKLASALALTLSLLLCANLQAASDTSYDIAQRAYERSDFKEAESRFRTLANNGHPPAQYNLGVMYTRGEGLPQDLVQAYLWFSLAASKRYGSARQSRAAVRRALNPSQVTEAQRLIDEWKSQRK